MKHLLTIGAAAMLLLPAECVAADSPVSAVGRTVLNLGYGGDKTQNLLWRMEHGELDGYTAKCICSRRICRTQFYR